MRFQFDIDTQRGLVCVVGLFGLFCEQALYAAFNLPPNDVLTGAFITLSIGPVVTGTIDRYKQKRGDPPPPPPNGEERPTGVIPTGDKESDDWNRNRGWLEATAF